MSRRVTTDSPLVLVVPDAAVSTTAGEEVVDLSGVPTGGVTTNDVTNESDLAGVTLTAALNSADTRITAAQSTADGAAGDATAAQSTADAAQVTADAAAAGLTLKADIDSPALTGNPSAPTADVQLYGTTTLATMEAVIAAYGPPAIDLWDDFEARTGAGRINWTSLSSGGSSAAPVVVTGRNGVTALSTSNSASGRSSLGFEASGLPPPFFLSALQGFMLEFVAAPELLSDPVNNRCTYTLGLMAGGGVGADFTDGVGVYYDPGSGLNPQTAQWVFAARTGGVQTAAVFSDPGVTTLQAGVFQYLAFIYTPAAGCAFYCGSTKATAVLIGTIPTAQLTWTGSVGPMMKARKTTGTTARRLFVDYVRFRGLTAR